MTYVSLGDNIFEPSELYTRDIEDVLYKLYDGTWSAYINKYRKGELDKVKLPYILFHGEFSKRSSVDLIKHSGYLCLDIDASDNPGLIMPHLKNVLFELPYTKAVWESPSQNGLRCLVKLDATPKDADGHKSAANQAINYYQESILHRHFSNVIFDQQVTAVSAATYVSVDSDMYYTDECESFYWYKPKPAKPKKSKKIKGHLSQTEVVAGLNLIGITGEYKTDCYRCGCPLCGGNTRFRVHEDGRFFCAKCLQNYQTKEHQERKAAIDDKLRAALTAV